MTCGTTTTAEPGSYANPLKLRKGATFTHRVYMRTATDGSQDLTSYSARAQLRAAIDAPQVSATFTVTIRSPATLGQADVVLGASQSLVLPTGLYVFDVEFFDPSDADDVLATGVLYVQVIDEVTRAV